MNNRKNNDTRKNINPIINVTKLKMLIVRFNFRENIKPTTIETIDTTKNTKDVNIHVNHGFKNAVRPTTLR